MTETIEVRYKSEGSFTIGGDPVGVFHKYIVYTDSNGNKSATRAGPTTDTEAGLYGAAFAARASLQAIAALPGVVYGLTGKIVTHTSEWNSGFEDYTSGSPDPGEVIAQSSNLSTQWAAITSRMAAISGNYTYF